jgi:integrase
MNLEKRIAELITAEWKEVQFDSKRLYGWVAERLKGSVTIEGADPIVATATRNVIRHMRVDGRRVFQNAHILDENGEPQRVYVQMRFADFDQALSIVRQSESHAIAMIKESNNLAVEAQTFGHQIPLPFPDWADEADAK